MSMDTVIDLSEQTVAVENSAEQVPDTHSSSDTPQLLDDVRSQIGQEMAGQLWQAGKQSTQKFINMYAHIDFLRPYFDVEPREIRSRFLWSFFPSKSVGAPQDVASELYGPLMLTLTLVSVLLYGMKTSGHEVEEGTLIGTAMLICFSYWLGISSLMFFIAYLFNAHFSFVQVLSLTGYSLSGHCSILLLSTLFDHYGTPSIFWLLWITLGGFSALRMVGVYISRTWSLREGAILGGLSVAFHMLSILYLRLEYHRVYEEVTVDEESGLKRYPFELQPIPRLHWEDPTADHLMTHEQPVILTGTDLVTPSLRWNLSYLEDNMGSGKHTVYISKSPRFMYFDDKKVNNFPNFREPMKKREWTFSKFVDELKAHMGRTDEYIYFQDTLTDAVGTSIKHDFVHFNWRWLNERKKRYNWGQLTTNLLLIGQPGNITPCHYDEQHNYFCQVVGEKQCMLFSPENFERLYPYPVAHPCDRQSQVNLDNPDFEKFPKFGDGLKGYESIVKPGDVLYIPMYWWHYIESLPKGGITMSITFWYRSGPVPSKITYPLNAQQKTAITRNIEKMLNEALQDPAEVGPLLHMIVDGRY